MATVKKKCCCKCWIKVSKTFDCDTYSWGSDPTVVAKQCAPPPEGEPRVEWFLSDEDDCVAFLWFDLGDCSVCDTQTVGEVYDPVEGVQLPGDPPFSPGPDCCEEEPEDPGDPPPDGTSCGTDSATYALCSGFSIDHTCKTVYTCDSTPPPPDVNAANGTARILNGSAGNSSAAFLHPNGMYLFPGGSGAIDFPRRTPGSLVGSDVSPAQFRAGVHSWGVGDPNSCDDAFGGFGNLGAGMLVDVDCSDPSVDKVRARIEFPFPQNECTGNNVAFDSGWVSTSKSNGLRKTVILSDSAGSPNVFLTNGTIAVSYCC
jgi:hypothetical protein